MAFDIRKHTRQTFSVVLSNANGEPIDEVTLMGLSIMQWDDIGLQVVTPEAKPKKDPKTKKFVPDVAAQRKLDAKAELKRNSMRLIWALENGMGINWGDSEPETLDEKADVFMSQLGWDVFSALLQALQIWAFGMKVEAVDDAARFQSVSENGNADMPGNGLAGS